MGQNGETKNGGKRMIGLTEENKMEKYGEWDVAEVKSQKREILHRKLP